MLGGIVILQPFEMWKVAEGNGEGEEAPQVQKKGHDAPWGQHKTSGRKDGWGSCASDDLCQRSPIPGSHLKVTLHPPTHNQIVSVRP